MAIRKRKCVNGISYQVYWNDPDTGARHSKTFYSLHDARKYDSIIAHRLKFERESFAESAQTDHCTLEGAVFLYLKDKHFDDATAKPFLAATKLPCCGLGTFCLKM